MTAHHPGPPQLGITVLGDFLLSEGVATVLDNVQKAGATAVACNPTVTVAAEEGTGSFQPPLDGGTSPRRFDRPLFGRHALWLHSAPSFHPNPAFYENSPYGPRQANELTDQRGEVIATFLDEAHRRGLKVYLQVGAAQPSGLRDEDRPRLPSGQLSPNRMADTASLASEAVRAYNRAYLRDLLAAYPQVDGLRIDWPESPCYTFDDIFQDFGAPVQQWADEHGYEFEALCEDVGTFYEFLQHRLTNEILRDFAGPDRGKFPMLALLNRYPFIAEWLRLKSDLAVDLVQDWDEMLKEYSGEYELIAHAFMPPYTLLTGLDFARIAEFSDTVAPKLYTMHWSLMVQFWAEGVMQYNAELDEELVVRSLVNLMDLADPGEGGRRLSDYGYPQPDEPHPIPDGPQKRKIEQARLSTAGKAAVTPMVHGYGPLEDFRRRFRLAAESDVDGLWINRYGYLSDEKLAAVGEISHAMSDAR